MGAPATFSCRDAAHLDELLISLDAAGIAIEPLPQVEDDLREFRFRRDKGLVSGTLITMERPWFLGLGWGHTFNPFRWSNDDRLCREVVRLFLEHGCVRR